MRVFVAQHPAEARLLKGLLESNGIPSEVRGEALFGVPGEIPFTEAFPEIWGSMTIRQAERLRSFVTES